MDNKKINYKITNREKDILEILWNSDSPLIASDIPKLHPSISISSVQLALRNLLAKNLVEVADIVYSGTVLCRRYRPSVSRQDFVSNEIINGFQYFERTLLIKNIVATLLKHEKDEAATIEELEKLLEERKRQLARDSAEESEE